MKVTSDSVAKELEEKRNEYVLIAMNYIQIFSLQSRLLRNFFTDNQNEKYDI